ncbi:helitron helicase-like domain-containing protein [Artemisia annua]|uniref:Helitron helicase-like domain-containing protein n=1 Tax=Artemisia annua TaxID=35608 RepID=A0A2U1KHE1_ARTAN|nr:helitron helicase-like domain-containing protein [Artemisia annua]
MRTKGKGKRKDTEPTSVNINTSQSETNVSPSLPVGVDMFGSAVGDRLDHSGHECFATRLKRKITHASSVVEGSSAKRLACATGPGSSMDGVSVGHAVGQPCEQPQEQRDAQLFNTFPQHSAISHSQQPFVLDFASGTIYPKLYTDNARPTGVNNDNGKRPADVCLESVAQQTSSVKRRRTLLSTGSVHERPTPAASLAPQGVLHSLRATGVPSQNVQCTMTPTSLATEMVGNTSVAYHEGMSITINGPNTSTPVTESSTSVHPEIPVNSRPVAEGLHNLTHMPTHEQFFGGPPQQPRRQRMQNPRFGLPAEYRRFGSCQCVCFYCHAKFWYEERISSSTRRTGPLPTFLLRHIRAYNQMFLMTSLGATVDESVNNDRGPYVFKVSGQIYHCIGKLCPDQGTNPRFLQLYIYDTDNEVQYRLKIFENNGGNVLRREIVEGLIKLLDEHNTLVQLFRTARDKLQQQDVPEFRVRLFSVVGSAQHELPTADNIGAIVFDSGPQTEAEFDIVVEAHSGEPQRISRLYPGYMALYFPLLFIYGEHGYHTDLRLIDVQGTDPDSDKGMSMNQFYAYQIHDRADRYKITSGQKENDIKSKPHRHNEAISLDGEHHHHHDPTGSQ